MIRDAGAFGVVEVYWEVTNPSTDISATSGVLVFAEGERTAVLEIVALPDDNPEAAETYRVELLGASGDARLGSAFTSASITILQNDDPIRFSSGFAEISEGDTATLTLIRGGQANGEGYECGGGGGGDTVSLNHYECGGDTVSLNLIRGGQANGEDYKCGGTLLASL